MRINISVDDYQLDGLVAAIKEMNDYLKTVTVDGNIDPPDWGVYNQTMNELGLVVSGWAKFLLASLER